MYEVKQKHRDGLLHVFFGVKIVSLHRTDNIIRQDDILKEGLSLSPPGMTTLLHPQHKKQDSQLPPLEPHQHQATPAPTQVLVLPECKLL